MQHQQGDERRGEYPVQRHPGLFEAFAEGVGQGQQQGGHIAGRAPVEGEQHRSQLNVGYLRAGHVARQNAVQQAGYEKYHPEGDVYIVKEAVEFFAAAYAGDKFKGGHRGGYGRDPCKNDTDKHFWFSSFSCSVWSDIKGAS
jgi:hypothetical protein